ncbi:MAG: PAS domain S-box protein, partial [Nitrospinaceae bacterium]
SKSLARADSGTGKLPPGHPPIKTFMGCAIYVQETLVGVVGMANRPQGYGKDLVTFFGALLATCANLLHAFRVEAGRRLAEETVRRREQQYKAVVDNVLDGIITMDESSVIQAINPAAERIFGYPPEEVTGKKFNLFLAGESAQEQEATLREYLATEKPGIIGFTRQVTGVRKDGASFPLELAISEVRTGAERRFLGITRDISETRRVQELREQFASIVENTDDAILGKQLDGTITLWNQAAKRIFGYSELEIVGKHISLLMPADHQAEAAYIVEKVRRGETLSNFETKRVHKNGALFDVSLTASPIRSAKGDIIGVSTISRNITAQKTLLREKEELIKKLEEATLTDPLTNLLNRRGLMQRMEYEVARMRRNGRPFSILLADLDRFKEINDRFGHDEGDRVLVQTAAILTQTTREQDLVCRWGGEEFLIILVETDLEGARHVAEKIRTTFLESSSTPEGEARPATISIGISVFDQPSLSPEEKIKAADECLYKAKSLGRNRVVAEGTRFSSTGEDADSLPS